MSASGPHVRTPPSRAARRCQRRLRAGGVVAPRPSAPGAPLAPSPSRPRGGHARDSVGPPRRQRRTASASRVAVAPPLPGGAPEPGHGSTPNVDRSSRSCSSGSSEGYPLKKASGSWTMRSSAKKPLPTPSARKSRRSRPTITFGRGEFIGTLIRIGLPSCTAPSRRMKLKCTPSPPVQAKASEFAGVLE